MAPRRAALLFVARVPHAARFVVSLFGSLAATGRGHLTDMAIEQVFTEHAAGRRLDIVWKTGTFLPLHANALRFVALDDSDGVIDSWEVYSTGGGALAENRDGRLAPIAEPFEQDGFGGEVYPVRTMEAILSSLVEHGGSLWDFVCDNERGAIADFLSETWKTMKVSMRAGLEAEGRLPGALRLSRKAASYAVKAKMMGTAFVTTTKLFAYALAMAEENASGNRVVTAPTCGSCGVVPAVLLAMQEKFSFRDNEIVAALGVAGLIGILAKTNGSISGAEVGCQGEIGVACAMASAAAAKLLGGTNAQIEYAAEIGLEHYLGLTCDPILGLVQVPCIERNALAATKAIASAQYALLSDGRHLVQFDEIVETMLRTGRDLSPNYRETSTGGLAVVTRL